MKHPLLRCCCFVTLLVLGLMASPAAHAAISCTASMSDVGFGDVDPQATQTDTAATLSYTCENDGLLPWSARVCFSIGVPGGGSTSTRRMNDGAGNTLNFQLYQNPGRTVVWGTQYSGTAPPLVVDLTIPGRGAFQPPVSVSGTAQLYGRVQAGQTLARPGDYTSKYLAADTALTVNDIRNNPPPDTCATRNSGQFHFNVSGKVVKKCSLTVSPLNFGTNPGLLNAAVNASTTLGVQCSRTTPYSVALGAGLNSGNDVNARKMVLAGNSLGYQLYRDAARTQVWGMVATDRVNGTGTGLVQSLTVYGRVPAQSTPPAGTYEDTVVVTVTY